MMIDGVLMFARDLALAVWLGGLNMIDFVEACLGLFPLLRELITSHATS